MDRTGLGHGYMRTDCIYTRIMMTRWAVGGDGDGNGNGMGWERAPKNLTP